MESLLQTIPSWSLALLLLIHIADNNAEITIPVALKPLSLSFRPLHEHTVFLPL